jgi:hypothetical protein
MVMLFILAALLVGGMVLFGMLDAHVMPWSCPACARGDDSNIAGEFRHWYVQRDGRTRCRWCGARFREHPNGSLVADPD